MKGVKNKMNFLCINEFGEKVDVYIPDEDVIGYQVVKEYEGFINKVQWEFTDKGAEIFDRYNIKKDID